MPVLLFVTAVVVRLRAVLLFSFRPKFFLIVRVSAALARLSRALVVMRRVLRGVAARRAYAPRPLIEAMCVTPPFRLSDDARRPGRLRGLLT